MGNKSSNSIVVKEKDENAKISQVNLTKSSFDFLYVIGKGGFGKVKCLLIRYGK
jgi:hypothetical protein